MSSFLETVISAMKIFKKLICRKAYKIAKGITCSNKMIFEKNIFKRKSACIGQAKIEMMRIKPGHYTVVQCIAGVTALCTG